MLRLVMKAGFPHRGLLTHSKIMAVAAMDNVHAVLHSQYDEPKPVISTK